MDAVEFHLPALKIMKYSDKTYAVKLLFSRPIYSNISSKLHDIIAHNYFFIVIISDANCDSIKTAHVPLYISRFTAFNDYGVW